MVGGGPSSWFADPWPLLPLPDFLESQAAPRRLFLPGEQQVSAPAGRQPARPAFVVSAVVGAACAPSTVPLQGGNAPRAGKRVRQSASPAAPDLPDPALHYGKAWAGRCRVLLRGQLYAVPYRVSDLADDVRDDDDELLVVELSWGGSAGWLEDRGVAFVLKERHDGRPPLRVTAEEVRRVVQQRVDLNRAPARALRRAIYGLHRPSSGLTVTLLPMADLAVESLEEDRGDVDDGGEATTAVAASSAAASIA